MSYLFESIAEAKSEREAIMIESSVPDAVESAADDIHRGKAPADKLRADCRIAWAKRREEMAGQA